MEYKTGMLCKHFKGENLLEKNIYRIEQIGVEGKDINETLITYTRDGEFLTAKNLVVYSNIFQENKLFAREYDDISGELSSEKKEMYNQEIEALPLRSYLFGSGRSGVIGSGFLSRGFVLYDTVKFRILFIQNTADGACNKSGCKIGNNSEQRGGDQERDAEIFQCGQHNEVLSFHIIRYIIQYNV